MGIKGFIPWICVGVLVVLLAWSLNTDSGEPVVVEKRTTDTLVQVVHDTTVITKVVTKKEPADTVYITIRDSVFVPVPRQEYTFSEPDLFDFRVKGFDVEFLEAKVYPKTEYRTVVETKETTIRENKSALFLYGGLSYFSESFYPKGGLALSLKNKWLISADIGYFQKHAIVGATVGYNMLNR